MYEGSLRYVKDVEICSPYDCLINHYRPCTAVGKFSTCWAHPCHVCLQCCHLVIVLILSHGCLLSVYYWLFQPTQELSLLRRPKWVLFTCTHQTCDTQTHTSQTITRPAPWSLSLYDDTSSQNTKFPNLTQTELPLLYKTKAHTIRLKFVILCTFKDSFVDVNQLWQCFSTLFLKAHQLSELFWIKHMLLNSLAC